MIKAINYTALLFYFYTISVIAEDVSGVKCDNYSAGGNVYKICLMNIDGVDVPHGKQEIVNDKGVVVLEQNYERGEEVGFLVNRADNGKVLKVCYFTRDKDDPDCIDL
ncbi:hypothetical protein [Microbulbifer sp. THAF38]|uniref:hypothetical protein n=1 Tax=Microbulbifer sp. THAF38 TaxID=2587856 RepID=UPI00126979C0|nr:hypothetical protein [Microbulbifer sp. THAF38]QFT55205.1 hypothetical protein FIU95_11615 [Microbulbifer sp. THAF38]